LRLSVLGPGAVLVLALFPAMAVARDDLAAGAPRPQWIGPMDVTDELARAKAEAFSRARVRAEVSTANQTAFNFHYYDLDLHPNPATSVLTGSVRSLASVVAGPVSTLELDLDSSHMTVDGVTCAGVPATFTHVSDLLQVNLNRTYQTGETVDITVQYHGTPLTGAFGGAFTFLTHSGTPLVTTLSEPFDARLWWPCKDDPSDKADSVDVRVTVPSGMITASNGTLVESTDNGTTASCHWKCRHRIATYLVSIASFAYSTSSDWYVPAAAGTMEIQFYIFPEHVASSATVNAKVKTMIAAYAARYGEYPFVDEKYGEAEFTWGGGMENQTCTSLGAFSEGIVAHELSHEWFGDAITCRDFHHIWLNEGFATYSEALWAEAQGGYSAYTQSMSLKRYLGAGTIYVPDLNDPYRIFSSDLSYRKPSWVLHMLRHILGETTFFAALKSYVQQYGYGTAVTEDFEHVCESVSELDLSRFFQEWIYGEYYPVYQVAWTNAPAGGGYDVTLQLQQTQTWQLFWMPVDVRIQTGSGSYDFVVHDSLSVQSFTLHVPAAPTSLFIDPDSWILRDISYPTAVALDAPHAGALELAPLSPNPARGPAMVSFATPRAGRATLALLDVTGRRVASLFEGSLPAGTHTVAWDGRDASGQAARAGVYWVSLDFERERVARRIAVVP
jgi:aminopeptidase N